MTAEATIEVQRVRLRDGRSIVIRQLERSDRAALLAFGHALPRADQVYIPDDLESAEIVNRYVDACAAEHWRQLVAGAGDLIVAYGSVLIRPGRSSHVATLHLVVSSGWRHCGLAKSLIPSLLDTARAMGATRATVELLVEQTSGRALFESLGFRLEATLDAHARGRDGHAHTLLVLARDLM